MPLLEIAGIKYLSDYTRYNNPNLAGYYKPSYTKVLLDYLNSNNNLNKNYEWKEYFNTKAYNQSILYSDLTFSEKRVGRKFDNVYHSVPDTSNTFFKGRRLFLCAFAVGVLNYLITKRNFAVFNNYYIAKSYFYTHYRRYIFNSVLVYCLYSLCDEAV